MTLDEAIKHCEEVAAENEKTIAYYTIQGDKEWLDECEKDCIECAKEHRQLAEWLLKLKKYHRGIEKIKELKDGFNQIPLSLEASVLESALELLEEEGEPQKNAGDDTMTKDQLANFFEATKGQWIFKTESGRVIKGEEIEKQIIESLRNSKPKAQWKMIGTIGLAFKCSRCKENSIKNSNYCPNCGAKMEGAE